MRVPSIFGGRDRRSDDAGSDERSPINPIELIERRAARVVRRMRLAELTLTAVAVLALPAIASATPGGTIFGADASTAGDAVREFVKWFRNIIFLVGVGGVGVGCVQLMRKREWGNWIGGGACCMAFGVIAAVVYELAQGNSVDVNTDLGN